MKIGGKKVTPVELVVFVVLALVVASYLELIPFTIQSAQTNIELGDTATWYTTTSRNNFLYTQGCEDYLNGIGEYDSTSIIQQLTIRNQNTGEIIYTPQPRYGYPDCAQFQYNWPAYSWTAVAVGSYTLVEEVRDTYTNDIIDSDSFNFIVWEDTPAECTPGQQICDPSYNPDRILICSDSGHYTIWGETCLNGCNADFTGCAQLCTPGTYKCLGGETSAQYRYCDADGLGWGPTQTCTYTYQPPTLCVEGQATPCNEVAICGDGWCDPERETIATCPSDCNNPNPHCGNGVCSPELGETALTCPYDCNECYGDQSQMDHETLCDCFPTHEDCQTVIPDWIYTLVVVGAITGGGLLMYLALRKKR